MFYETASQPMFDCELLKALQTQLCRGDIVV